MKAVRGRLADRQITTRGRVVDNEVETFGMAPTLEAEIGGAWPARLTGFYGTDKTYGVTQHFTNDVEARSIRIFANRSVSVEAGIESPLFTLQIGRASCRETVCHSVLNLSVTCPFKK